MTPEEARRQMFQGFGECTVCRVMFGQTAQGLVTASLRHTLGPLVVGERVLAYELDDPPLCAWATVEQYDPERERALLRVDTRPAAARPAAEGDEEARGRMLLLTTDLGESIVPQLKRRLGL